MWPDLFISLKKSVKFIDSVKFQKLVKNCILLNHYKFFILTKQNQQYLCFILLLKIIVSLIETKCKLDYKKIFT